MPRYEVRFYDAMERVKIAVELDAPDQPGAEIAAKLYLLGDVRGRLLTDHVLLGVCRELR